MTTALGPGTGASQSPMAAPLLRPFDRLGNYQILRHVGGGGMAQVYLARAMLGAGAEKLVAFKTALPGFGPETPLGNLFLHEARVSVSLQHANVVQVFDSGEAGGRVYIAMEYLPGRDLAAVLRRLRERSAPVPPGLVFALGIELCAALEYVHGKKDLDGRPLGLVHRDVNPGNVMLTATGTIKLMDFGVAAASLDANDPHVLAGTRAYACAEQFEGGTPAPHWDIYSTGRLLGELALATRDSQTQARLQALVDRATDDRVEARLHSARELRDGLLAVRGEAWSPSAVAAFLDQLFGAELRREETEDEALILDARRRLPSSSGLAVLRPIRWVRRRVAGSRFAMNHPLLARAVGAAMVAGLAAGVVMGLQHQRTESALREALNRADERLRAGELVGPGGDQALDHLARARAIAPDDERTTGRIALLVSTFEQLGEAALTRGDFAEAIVHFDAARRAAPERPHAAERIAELEAKVREQSKPRPRTRPEEPSR